MDYAQAVFGEHAVHVPAWVVVQDAGPGLVSFIGASRVESPHPLRYGSDTVHQLIVGEVIVRPHTVTASNAGIGQGLENLARNPFIVADGDKILDLGVRS